MHRNKASIRAKVYEITYDDPIILEDNRWSVFVNFRIIGEDEKIVHAHKVYTLVCSPEYQDNPGEENVDHKTLVMQTLKKDHIEEYIQEKVGVVNEVHTSTWDEYYSCLEKWFYVDD